MAMKLERWSTPSAPRTRSLKRAMASAVGGALGFVALLLLVVAGVSRVANRPELAADVLALAFPAFIGGVLSSLSPCSLPIILAYFSIALQERGERIGRITLAFLVGVGTTMTLLGASFTAIGALAIDYQVTLSLVGGLIVIGLGVMSLTGRGFAGPSLAHRPSVGIGGAYLHGLVFALGWTTCVGPILGAILTLLLAEGSSIGGALSLVSGALLVMIYVTGLGLPVLLLVGALSSGAAGSRTARVLRGRGWEIRVRGRTVSLHSTTAISGLLLIGLGVLLATGQLAAISQRLAGSPLARFDLLIEQWLDGVLR